MKQRYFLLILFFAGVLIRLPTLTLPLEGRAAVLASVADGLGHSRVWAVEDSPPLQPFLVAIVVASGADATRALRVMEGFAGALLAPLLMLLALRMGFGARVSRYSGLALLVHPMMIVHAGGARPDGNALALLLLLVTFLLLLSPLASRRRFGAAGGVALGIAHPAGALYMATALLGFATRESVSAWRNVAIGLGLALFFFGPCSVLNLVTTSGGASSFAPTTVWIAVAALGLLVLGLPLGIVSALREGAWVGWILRAWMVAAAVHLGLIVVRGAPEAFAWSWDLLGTGCLLVPLIVLLGMRGVVPFDGRVALSIRAVSLLVGLLTVAALVFTNQMGWMLGAKPHPGASLAKLRTAARLAASQAGPKGWILCDIEPDFAAAECSLADVFGDQYFWSPHDKRPSDPTAHIRTLRRFPAAAYKPGNPIVVLARAGTLGETRVLSDGTILRHEVVDQIGPYVILLGHKSD